MKKALFLIVVFFIADDYAVTVDLYQDCESGAVGDSLTASGMNASSHGAGTWSVPSGRMRVSGNKAKKLPGTVTVRGGPTYADTGTRTWTVANAYMMNYVMVTLPGSHMKCTMACHFTCGTTSNIYNWYDLLAMHNPYSGVGSMHRAGGQALHIDGETCGDNWKNWVTNPEPGIPMTPGKTYWVNLNLNYTNATFNIAVFDPDNGYAQAGSTITLASATQCSRNGTVSFGQESPHGDVPSDSTFSNFDNILIDYTNGTFPLLPDINSSLDTTAPGPHRSPRHESTQVHLELSSPHGATTSVTIKVSLSNPEQATVAIYDLAGRETATVAQRRIEPGTWIFSWDKRRSAGGCYMARVRTRTTSCIRYFAIVR